MIKPSLFVALLGAAVFALAPSAWADCGHCGPDKAKDVHAAHDGASCPCPMCPKHGEGETSASADDTQSHQAKALLNAELSKNDPAFLLAMHDEIDLTVEQRQQIEQIQREARDRVQQILTQDQRQELASLPEQPTSFNALHQSMMSDTPEHMATQTPEPSTVEIQERDRANTALEDEPGIDVQPDAAASRGVEREYPPAAGTEGHTQP